MYTIWPSYLELIVYCTAKLREGEERISTRSQSGVLQCTEHADRRREQSKQRKRKHTDELNSVLAGKEACKLQRNCSRERFGQFPG